MARSTTRTIIRAVTLRAASLIWATVSALDTSLAPAYAGTLQGGIDRATRAGEAGGLSSPSYGVVIGRAVLFLLGLAAVLALGVLIAGSIAYIISLGDENRVQRAKRIILYAIIGLLLTGASFTILVAIRAILVL